MEGSKLRRIGAFIIDMIILNVVVALSENMMEPLTEESSFKFLGQWFRIKIGFSFILYVLYFILFDLINQGATLGKVIFGIRVVSEDNSVPGNSTLMKRTLLKIVSILILPIAILLFFLNESYTIQDHYAKTITVRKR